MSIGLALSGGGSRAAAFHGGTLAGLDAVGLLASVDVVSTVSGGSVFGAAWVASLKRGEALGAFQSRLRAELGKGFIARALLSWRTLALPFPGTTRTDLLAVAFDRIFYQGLTLGGLPERPLLCVNAAVLNTGQVGQFYRDGFRTAGRFLPGQRSVDLPVARMTDFPLARAVAASAAFPIGLKPVSLRRGRELPGDWGAGTDLSGLDALELTDGGVLENLGAESLLKRGPFQSWDMVVSDAGTAPGLWKPSLKDRAESTFMGMASAEILKQISILMNDKNDRHTRHEVMAALEGSWAASVLLDPSQRTQALDEQLGRTFDGLRSAPAPLVRRNVLMVRVDQDWDHLTSNVPRWRLMELALHAGASLPAPGRETPEGVESLLEALGVDLASAREAYARMGGPAGVRRANAVATGFSALAPQDLDALHDHALWQVYALKALYWD